MNSRSATPLSVARAPRRTMADAKDILGIPRGGASAPKSRAKAKPSLKPPKGVHREVWQITRGREGDDERDDARAAIVPSALSLHGMKDKRKITARTVTWQWQPFRNSARTDQLQLKHWVKKAVGGAQPTLMGTNGGDVGGDYAFAKYNKKIEMLKYTSDEYERVLKHLDDSWTKEETDYLFERLERFDLRFIVVVDRWDFASQQTRTVEDLKVRYYSIAKTLIEARAESPEEAAAHQIVKMPFNAQHELDRKVALNTLLNRTNGEMKEEAEILKRVREIEKRRRTENQALLQKATAVFSTSRTHMVQNPVSIDDVRADFETLAPELPLRGSAALKPGPYLRGQHFIAVANEQANAAQGGARFAKRIDQSLEDLGVKTPSMNTHAVCAGWLKLREETIELLRVRKKLVTVYERLVAKGKTPGYIPGMADVEAKKAVGGLEHKIVPRRVASAGEIKREDSIPPTPASMKRKAVETPTRGMQKVQRHKRN